MDEKFLEDAEDLIRAMTEKAIEACRAQQTKPPADFDGSCECGNSIPPARVTLGYYRCIECQSSLEKRSRTYRR